MEHKKKKGNPNLRQQTLSSPSDTGNHHPHQNCPRCNSSKTKFCYYNNYSLSQPRYFCKTCNRHWTHGGTTRNIPIGGNRKKCPPKPNPPATIPPVQTPVPLLPAMPLYDGIPYLPSIATMKAITSYGVDLSLLQAQCLESFKSQGSGNQFQSPGNLFTAQENLMNRSISPWDLNINATGSSSSSALNQGEGDNHPGYNPPPQ